MSNKDVFISYAHVDNIPFGDTEGWVSLLHQRLQTRLYQLTGERPQIWWDEREQQAGHYLVGMIGSQVSDTLLMVAVVSPRYVNSDWCLGELSEFCRRADQTGGIVVGDQPRIFGVVKTPVAAGRLPQELCGLLRHEFYEVDANGHVREFRTETGANKDQKYWDKFEDLAQGVKQALERLRTGPREAPEPKPLPLSKMVYLAETTDDLSTTRDRIRRELLQREYYVLPDSDLPRSATKLRASAREHLERCALSVHLIGGSYGFIPEGEEEHSAVRMQEELAAERAAADPSFSRLLWMPMGLAPSGARQTAYVEGLQTRLAAGAELLQTSVEDLKTRIMEKLEPASKPAAEAASDGGPTSVYLICDNRDSRGAEPIEECLFEQGYEVIPSLAGDGGAHEVAQYHRESLLNCDAALVYCGNAGLPWLRMKMFDLQKAQGWGRSRPMRTKGVYMTVAEHEAEKRRFRTHEVPVVIKDSDGFSCDRLRPFLEALRG